MEISTLAREILYWRGMHLKIREVQALDELHIHNGPLYLGDPLAANKQGSLSYPLTQTHLKPRLYFDQFGQIALLELSITEESPWSWSYLHTLSLPSGRLLAMDLSVGALVKQTRLELEYEDPADYWQEVVEPQLNYKGQAAFGLWRPQSFRADNLLYIQADPNEEQAFAYLGLDNEGEICALAFDFGLLPQDEPAWY